MKEDFTQQSGFMKNRAVSVTLRLILAAAVLFVMATTADKYGSLCYAVSTAVFAFAASLNMMCTVTCAKAANLHRYKVGGIFYGLARGRVVAYTFIVICVFFFSFAAVIRLYLLTDTERLLMLAIVPAFAAAHFISKKLSGLIYKGEYAEYSVRRMSYIFTAIFMALAFPLAAQYFSQSPEPASLQAAADAAFVRISPLQNNPVAYGVAYVIGLSDGVTAFAVSLGKSAGGIYKIAVLLYFLGNGLFFYMLVNFTGAFFLNRAELKSVIEPVGEDKTAYGMNKFSAAFFSVIILVFIYPAIVAYVTLSIPVRDIVALEVNGYVKTGAEKIDGALYRAGTLSEIDGARAGFYATNPEELRRAINSYYDEMESKTDDYLSWYYSLGAEYGRIWKVITGNIEDYMREKLKEKITPSADISVAFDTFSDNASKLMNNIDAILAANKLDGVPDKYQVISEVKLADIYKKSEVTNLVGLKDRVLISAGGSIAGLVAGKIASKTIFKTAAKSAAKLVLQKGAGAAAGVAVGAVTSIFASPLGGIALGTATGLALDKGMLKLEEAVNRNEHKREIISSINESRRELLDRLSTYTKDAAEPR